jgi:glucuronosyltransferase
MKVAVVLLLALALTDAARILGVFPHSGKTHYIVFEALLRELAARGHELVVMSHFPQRRPPPNWKDINLEGTQVNLAGLIKLEEGQGSNRFTTSFFDFWFITQFGNASCEDILGHPDVRDLVEKDTRGFDLIINEAFNTHCFLGLVHRFRPAPYIALTSHAPFSWDYTRLGSPVHTAIMPNTFLWCSDEMTFPERLYNTVYSLATRAYMELVWNPSAQRVVERHLGAGIPPLQQLADNASLMLINTHPALNRAKPISPAVIEIGGIHIPDLRPLPKVSVGGSREWGRLIISRQVFVPSALVPGEEPGEEGRGADSASSSGGGGVPLHGETLLLVWQQVNLPFSPSDHDIPFRHRILPPVHRWQLVLRGE